VNGGFEQPVLLSDSYRLYTPGQRFLGWKVVGPSGSNVDVINRNLAGVSQTVTTVRKARYRLTFWVCNVVDRGGIFGTKSTVGDREWKARHARHQQRRRW